MFTLKNSFSTSVGCTWGDSAESQSQYYLSTVTGLTRSDAGYGPRHFPIDESYTTQVANIAETPRPEDIPLALLAQQEKLGKLKG